MPRPYFRLIALFFCILFGRYAVAVESLELDVGNLTGDGWQLEKISASWHFTEIDSALKLSVEQIQSGLLLEPLHAVSVTCDNLRREAFTLNCANAALNLDKPLLDTPEFAFSFTQTANAMAAGINALKLGGGELAAMWHTDDIANETTARLEIQALSLDTLLANLGSLIKLPAMTFGGTLTATLSLTQTSDKLSLTASGNIDKFQFSNAEGTQVAQGVDLKFDLSASQSGDVWQLQFVTQFSSGEVYSEPVYVQLKGAPIKVGGVLNWHSESARLEISQFDYSHPGVLAFQAQAAATFGETVSVQRAVLNMSPFSLNNIYENYLQFLLDDLGFSNLDIQGGIAAQLDWGEEKGSASISLENITLTDADANFLLADLNGEVFWGTTPDASQPSRLSWQAGKILKNLSLGGTQLELLLYGNNLELQQPVSLDILDGALRVDTLGVKDLGGETQNMQFAGMLRPITLQALTKAFGLPELGGQIAGVIPGLQFANNKVEINGALQVKVFDGDIVIHELTLDKLLSDLPILSMDLDIQNLDLHTLTEFFSFGAITGRVSGHVRKLYMLNWQPIAFDAYLGTSEDDNSRRRISQKAVQNLSSIGGAGVTDVLSRSVLSFFEEFRYSKIGWGCVLQHGVCQMRGAEATDNGYYIVKGGGLPRIDVLGFNQTVDWAVLLERLKNATEIGAPVIE